MNLYERMASFDMFPNDYEEVVTPAVAMTQEVFAACLRIVCDMVASAPATVYRRGQDKEKAEVPEQAVLHDFPNPYQTAFRWKWDVVRDTILHGFALSEVVRTAGGDLAELYRIEPAAVRLQVDIDDQDLGIFRRYTIHTRQGTKKLDNGDALFFCMRTDSDGLPMSFVKLASDSLGLSRAVTRYTAKRYMEDPGFDTFFMYPRGVFKSESDRTATAEYLTKTDPFKRNSRILEGCDSIQKLQTNFNDAALLETRGYIEKRISGIFGIPVGLLNAAAGSASEEVWHQLLTGCLEPWFKMIDSEFNRILFYRRGNRDYYVEHNRGAFLRGRFETMMKTLAIGITSGQITPNEAREMQNRPPKDGGDDLRVPVNTETVGNEPPLETSNETPFDAPDHSVDVYTGESLTVKPIGNSLNQNGEIG